MFANNTSTPALTTSATATSTTINHNNIINSIECD